MALLLRWLTLLAWYCLAVPGVGAGLNAQQNGGPSSKRARAIRVSGPSPVVDGRLDEAIWQEAAWLTDFVQKEPVEGDVPRERTEVGFLFDGGALYIGARLLSAIPGDIPRPVTRRDQVSNAEHLIISLDTYHDRRTGISFGISSGGVRLDYIHPSDAEDDRDLSVDPVWQGHVSVDSLGWTAEMRIPFSQLRFNKDSLQVWGLNINRWMPARNEDVYWVVVPKNETGYFSRFGELTGIEGIRPSRRLELLPYVAGEATFASNVSPADPFRDGSDFGGRAGVDLKMGLGPNLTLDATVNPDFGQVEADPAELNLTAFETFFPERRPFFTEGSQLLSGNGPAFFYSRRIGAAPRGSADGDFIDQPSNTTIIGAGKVAGRLASGLSVGALTAVTAREYGRGFDSTTSRTAHTQVGPLTGYGVARVQQEFGSSASTIGLMFTGVERDLPKGDGLRSLYNRRAYTGGADWNLRFNGGAYSLGGYLGFSHLEGDSTQILRLQEAPARFFQRPDAGYLHVDSSRTSMTGATAGLYFSKNAATHWLYDLSFGAESPDFDLNDAGRLQAGDDIDFGGSVNWRETRPGPVFHSVRIGLFANANYNYGWERQFSRLAVSSSQTWKGFQETFLGFYVVPAFLSDNLTRGGPRMGSPAAWGSDINVFSGEGGSTKWNLGGNVELDEFGGWSASGDGELSFRPSPRLQLSIDPHYSRGLSSRQYITTLDGGTPATFGARYVFGFVDQTVVSTQFRVTYALSPDLTVEGYMEPFAASGRYSRIGELPRARSRSIRRYGTDGTTLQRFGTDSIVVTDNAGANRYVLDNPDFRLLSFRSNLVLRWEWRPGSTLFLVWQQNRGESSVSDRRVGPGTLWKSVTAEGDQFVVLKLSYWLGVR